MEGTQSEADVIVSDLQKISLNTIDTQSSKQVMWINKITILTLYQTHVTSIKRKLWRLVRRINSLKLALSVILTHETIFLYIFFQYGRTPSAWSEIVD